MAFGNLLDILIINARHVAKPCAATRSRLSHADEIEPRESVYGRLCDPRWMTQPNAKRSPTSTVVRTPICVMTPAGADTMYMNDGLTFRTGAPSVTNTPNHRFASGLAVTCSQVIHRLPTVFPRVWLASPAIIEPPVSKPSRCFYLVDGLSSGARR